jgi:hypothetical protein
VLSSPRETVFKQVTKSFEGSKNKRCIKSENGFVTAQALVEGTP